MFLMHVQFFHIIIMFRVLVSAVGPSRILSLCFYSQLVVTPILYVNVVLQYDRIKRRWSFWGTQTPLATGLKNQTEKEIALKRAIKGIKQPNWLVRLANNCGLSFSPVIGSTQQYYLVRLVLGFVNRDTCLKRENRSVSSGAKFRIISSYWSPPRIDRVSNLKQSSIRTRGETKSMLQ